MAGVKRKKLFSEPTKINWMRQGGRLVRLKEHIEVEGSQGDRIFVLNPSTFKAKIVEQYAKLNNLNPSDTKSKDESQIPHTTGFTFQRYYDVLENLFDFLDVSDVATMAKVEPFLSEFVEENYHLRIVLPISEEQMTMLKTTKKKFVLRLESNCSPLMYINQLKIFKFRYLKEIKLLVNNDIFVAGYRIVDVYNEMMVQIFDKAPMLRKIEMSVNSRSVDVIKKFPPQLEELALNFGLAASNNGKRDDLVVSILETVLQTIKMNKLFIRNMATREDREIKLHSKSITSLTINLTKGIQIKVLQLSNLTHIKWEDGYIPNTFVEYLEMVYEGCPKLERINDVELTFSREIGVEEWVQKCKALLEAKQKEELDRFYEKYNNRVQGDDDSDESDNDSRVSSEPTDDDNSDESDSD